MSTINSWNNTVTDANAITLSTTAAGPVIIGSGTGTTTIGNLTGTTTLNFGGGSSLSSYIAKTAFTPVVKFGGGVTGITYSSQVGEYSIIGSLVIVNIDFQLSSKGSSTGSATISGLSLTPAATNVPAAIRINFVSYVGETQAYYNGTSFILENISTLGAVTDLVDTNFANNSSVRLSCSFVLN